MANRSRRTPSRFANIGRAGDITSCGPNWRKLPRGSRPSNRSSNNREPELRNWRGRSGKRGSRPRRQRRLNPEPGLAEPMDYRALGLKVGLEIHQQLATHKLFCEDVSALVDTADGQRFRRRLRPTQSELGEVDAAALEVVERLDRLGSPLVELATTPNIETPDEARDVALMFGSLLRATRKVKRGIGTIREDLNVSIEGGARIEIKGVQELRMIATFVEREVERQVMLLAAAAELKKRNIRSVPTDVRDVTAVFHKTESKVVRTALKKGGVVLGWALPGFAGLLKGKLGPELAAHARIAGVAGIFHSDELPGYGISREETEAVRATWGLGDRDAFVLVAEAEGKARAAFDEMRPRAITAVSGVPPETREPRPDGSTAYRRPLPGKARMYPETDVPPIRVTTDRLRKIREHLPEKPEVTIARLAREFGIHEQQARQLVQEGSHHAFESIAREFGEPTLVASVLLYSFGELRREGLDVDGIPLDHLRELFSLLKAGRFAKEALPGLVREMAGTRARARG